MIIRHYDIFYCHCHIAIYRIVIIVIVQNMKLELMKAVCFFVISKILNNKDMRQGLRIRHFPYDQSALNRVVGSLSFYHN